MSKPFSIIKKEPTKEVECEIDVHVEIEAKEVEQFRAEAIKNLGATIKIDGFREGKVPEKMLIDRLGEIAILEEAGQLALEKHYADILVATELKPLGAPKVLVTKLAPGEAFGVKINFATMPETKVADYKKVAKENFSLDKKAQETLDASLVATEKEIDEALKNLQDQVAHEEWHKANPDDHGHDHGKSQGKEIPTPELNDDFAKRFGTDTTPINTLADLKDRIAEGIKQEKARKELEKARLKLMETLIEKSEIKMPEMMVESEINRMIGEMSANISQMGLKLEDYLKHIGKTIEEMRAEAKPDAIKRAKTQLIMNEIAIKEKLEPNKEDVDKEVANLMNYYKDADKMRATIYVEQFMTNDLVWKFLEEQGK